MRLWYHDNQELAVAQAQVSELSSENERFHTCVLDVCLGRCAGARAARTDMEPAEVLNITAAPVCPLGPSLGTGPAYVSVRLTGVAR